MPDEANVKYNFSIGAIFKWEHRLPEWIEYHRMLGVEHFYLYDNEEPEPVAAHGVLLPYIERGVVTRFPWPGKAQQYAAYNDLIGQARGEADWLAVIDVDEFIQPLDGRPILEVLGDYDRPRIAGVAPHWCLFGNAGVQGPPELQLDAFVRRGRPDAWVNGLVKSIVRPVRIRRGISPHHFWPFEGHEIITEDGRSVQATMVPPAHWQKLRIVHYHCRSRVEYEQKRDRGDCWAGGTRGNTWDVHNLNEIEDRSMAQYAPAVRHRLEVIKNGSWID